MRIADFGLRIEEETTTLSFNPQSAIPNPQSRLLYLSAALPHIPRLLTNIDRNPYHATYGCLDRQFWHYRTADFPSEMYQEGVLPLALVYAHELPGNRWQGDARVRELAIAAIRFAARSCHADGSCDDYYPFERALGAAVFSLVACAAAYQLLELDDRELLAFLRRRARWVAEHDESGRLANHQALAALGLLHVAQIDASKEFLQAGIARLHKVLSWQSDEGWFVEYGGADPGYQTVTIECLAKCRRKLANRSVTLRVAHARLGESGYLAGHTVARRVSEGERADEFPSLTRRATCSVDDELGTATFLDEPLRRAVAFARWFLHPDDSYGGEYGSRGTYHFYPHGFELLAAEDASAAELADGFLRSLAAGKQACFDDDRMFAHRLGSLIEAYREAGRGRESFSSSASSRVELVRASFADCEKDSRPHWFPQAQILVHRAGQQHTVVSAARGGVFKHFRDADTRPMTDTGLIVETIDGRTAVSQMHTKAKRERGDAAEKPSLANASPWRASDASFTISRPLCWTRHETATPLKLVIFRIALLLLGRFARNVVRRLLQRRLISGRNICPISLARTIEFPESGDDRFTLRVTDRIDMTDPRLQIRRMSFGTDHQSAYVAASGVYQDSVLQPWTDLDEFVARLNAERTVTIVREL